MPGDIVTIYFLYPDASHQSPTIRAEHYHRTYPTPACPLCYTAKALLTGTMNSVDRFKNMMLIITPRGLLENDKDTCVTALMTYLSPVYPA